jgi:hypothetical protein
MAMLSIYPTGSTGDSGSPEGRLIFAWRCTACKHFNRVFAEQLFSYVHEKLECQNPDCCGRAYVVVTMAATEYRNVYPEEK